MGSKPLEVELPVCPQCFAVGKIPGRGIFATMKSKCIGPEGRGHKQTLMELRLFREVTDGNSSEAT